jgi:hypothetical protein
VKNAAPPAAMETPHRGLTLAETGRKLLSLVLGIADVVVLEYISAHISALIRRGGQSAAECSYNTVLPDDTLMVPCSNASMDTVVGTTTIADVETAGITLHTTDGAPYGQDRCVAWQSSSEWRLESVGGEYRLTVLISNESKDSRRIARCILRSGTVLSHPIAAT